MHCKVETVKEMKTLMLLGGIVNFLNNQDV